MTWMIVVGLLGFAAVHLLVRGPIDLNGNFNLCDLANHYSAARLWLIGQDPYDTQSLTVTWQASGWGAVNVPFEQWWSLLPPGAFVLLAPIAALSPGVAIFAWLMLNIVFIVAALLATMSIAKINPNSSTGGLFIAGALAAAPFQTLLAVGQVSLPAVSLLLVAVWCSQRGRDVLAGILIGAAGCLKPQLAAPFALFYLLYRNWRLVGCAAVSGAAVMIIGIAQLEWRGHDWWTAWNSNLAGSTAPAGANDPTLYAPYRHQIASLNVLAWSIASSRFLAVSIVLAVSTLLIATYAWLVRRGKLTQNSLLSLSILCGLSLLPVYHRSYDAALLLPAFAWALSELRTPLRRSAWATIIALSVLLVPFDALVLLQQKLGMFATVSPTWIWQAIIAPHHAWAVLGVSVCLLAALHLKTRNLKTAGNDESYEPAADILRLHADERALETVPRWREMRQVERARKTG